MNLFTLRYPRDRPIFDSPIPRVPRSIDFSNFLLQKKLDTSSHMYHDIRIYFIIMLKLYYITISQFNIIYIKLFLISNLKFCTLT